MDSIFFKTAKKYTGIFVAIELGLLGASYALYYGLNHSRGKHHLSESHLSVDLTVKGIDGIRVNFETDI